MRYFILAILVMTMPLIAIADEDTLSLDRCLILNSPSDPGAASLLALHFNLPNELSGKEVIYTELNFDIPPQDLETDSLFEIIMYPFLASWSEEELTYENSQSITDSLSTGAYTVKLADTNGYHIDITSYLKEVLTGDKENFGLIGTTDLLGNDNLRLSQNLGGIIEASARVRVVYK